MSEEEVREHIDQALRFAAVGDVDLDTVDAILDDAHDRVERLRVLEGDR